MPNWIDEQIQRQRFEDMVRTAQRDLLASDVLAAGLKRAPFYSPIMARLGRWLEDWGCRLQTRYGTVSEVAIASDSRANTSRW